MLAVARDWERWLATASGPASSTEEAERDRTLERVRKAIRASSEVPEDVRMYVKGSYANNTNVRRDADVDIAVEWTRTAKIRQWGSTAKLTPAQLGFTPVAPSMTSDEFRGRVERALIRALGSAVDVAPDKHIGVAAGSGTLEADVVPCFELHRYDDVNYYVVGHRIFPKSGGYVDNFPRQNYDNGVAKNNSTNHRYKEIVRAFKRLAGELYDDKAVSFDYPGYLAESLVFNAPDTCFGHSRRYDDLLRVMLFLQAGLQDGSYDTWTEPNKLVMLFRGHADRFPRNAELLVNASIDWLVK